MPHLQNKPFRFRNMPIRYKLLVITLLAALLISTVSLGGFQSVTSNYNRMLYAQTANSLGVVSDKIAARLNGLMDISLYIAVNREFQSNLSIINAQTLTAAHGVARSEISSLLYRTFHSDLISVSVIPLDSTPIVIGSNSSPETDGVHARVLELATQANGAPVWLSTGRGDSSVLCARIIRNVSWPFLEPMGLLLLRVDLNKIVRESAVDILHGEYNITISQHGELLYPHTESGGHIFDDSLFSGDLSYAINKKGSEVRFVTRSSIKAFRLNWSLILGIPYEDVFRSVMIANLSFAAGLVVAVILAVLLSRQLMDSINRNIQLLISKMNRVQKGDLEPYPDPAAPGEDELGALNRQFDKMTADFKQVIEDNYVKELLLTQTQLKALEQQVNPHFLYNSLESINWFARRGEGENVSTIAQALGSLLRSTMSLNEDLIPVDRELAILDSYLRIQRIRFSDTLRVQILACEDSANILIPKMSIQPLVENAIVHALEENIGECHVSVKVSLKEDMIWVAVENDGSEIDVDILDKLRNSSVSPKRNGIGLINIDSRIKLLYGQEYGLKFESGTDRVTVSFCLPVMTGEKKHAAKMS